VLDANPLEDVANLKKIHTVILNGKILDREKLLERPR
jgi:imidazolonepropionase-like amidohydrolase